MHRQVIMFYTIPPDVFHDKGAISARIGRQETRSGEKSETLSRFRDEDYLATKSFAASHPGSTAFPLEISGQPVATCNDLVELALDSCPEMIIWAFSAKGWARTWALNNGRMAKPTKTSIQRDGSIRHIDSDGDIAMTDTTVPGTTVPVDLEWPEDDEVAEERDGHNIETERHGRLTSTQDADRMSGVASVEVREENKIVRIDVELR